MDIEEFQVRTRPRVPLVTAIAGLGALVAAQFSIPAPIGTAATGLMSGSAIDMLVFTPIVALALALPAWHLFPRRAWPVLVVAGMVGAIAAGVTGIGSSYALDPPSDTPPTFAIYPPVMAFLVVAGALTLFAWSRWQADTRD